MKWEMTSGLALYLVSSVVNVELLPLLPFVSPEVCRVICVREESIGRSSFSAVSFLIALGDASDPVSSRCVVAASLAPTSPTSPPAPPRCASRRASSSASSSAASSSSPAAGPARWRPSSGCRPMVQARLQVSAAGPQRRCGTWVVASSTLGCSTALQLPFARTWKLASRPGTTSTSATYSMPSAYISRLDFQPSQEPTRKKRGHLASSSRRGSSSCSGTERTRRQLTALAS
mmetsp:Transcript_39525/g.102326  ORF Transcript_39525/g.102326 Transcript_39525/m.102326 type:complete len:232 (-) Transcript_39525:400-1095(-)